MSRVPSRASSAESRALTTELETPNFFAANVNERASTRRANSTIERTSEAEVAIDCSVIRTICARNSCLSRIVDSIIHWHRTTRSPEVPDVYCAFAVELPERDVH